MYMHVHVYAVSNSNLTPKFEFEFKFQTCVCCLYPRLGLLLALLWQYYTELCLKEGAGWNDSHWVPLQQLTAGGLGAGDLEGGREGGKEGGEEGEWKGGTERARKREKKEGRQGGKKGGKERGREREGGGREREGLLQLWFVVHTRLTLFMPSAQD